MKAVILAAGEGLRMRPLTETSPKPMLKLSGRPLLEHLLDVLPTEIDEVVLVIGYLGDHIAAHFGNEFGRFRISYVEQTKKEGTARALALCKHLLANQRFMTLYADDLHAREDLEKLLEHPLSVLVTEVPNPERFGVVLLDQEGHVTRIVEKPAKPESNLIVTGPAILDSRIFEYEPEPHENGERYLAEAIGELVKMHPVKAIRASFWLPIGYPEDLKRAERMLGKKKPTERRRLKKKK